MDRRKSYLLVVLLCGIAIILAIHVNNQDLLVFCVLAVIVIFTILHIRLNKG